MATTLSAAGSWTIKSRKDAKPELVAHNHTMKKSGDLPSSTKHRIKLLLLLIIGGAVVLFLVNNLSTSRSTPAVPIATSTANNAARISTGAATPAVISKQAQASKNATNVTAEAKPPITYLPGVQRPIKQRPGDLSDLSSTASQWWLLANSEKEAQWMDQMGYPTPAEERFLEAASEAELARLTSNGDMNAKAHLGIRAAKKALIAGKLSDAEKAAFELDTTLTYFGTSPYQAIVIAKAFGEMMWDYRELPEKEKTEERRAVLRLYNYREQSANVVASAFGEDSVRMLRNTLNYNDAEQELGGGIQRDLSRASNIFAASARSRPVLGLPPLTIIPKPITAPGPPDQRVIVERY
jgi:hypothetical protein